MITDDIGPIWAEKISDAFVEWAEEQRLSRSIKIQPFNPEPYVEGAFYEAGSLQLLELGALLGLEVSFNIRNKEAEAWIQKYSGDQIKYISATNRAAIRLIKLRAFQEGLTVQQQQKLIKDHIGLLPRHVVAVNNYYDVLIRSGEGEETAKRLASKYGAKLVRYRANMIGVSESMSASNNGIRITNESAVKRGILSKDEYWQEWVASGLKNVCEQCKAANGTHAEIGGTYPNGSMGPPIHPHDHCSVIIVRK